MTLWQQFLCMLGFILLVTWQPADGSLMIHHGPDQHGYKPADVECMALNIYHEARGDGHLEMLGVAWVTMNRVEREQWPNNICDVVKQKNQFEWYWDGKPDNVNWDNAIEVRAWRDIVDMTETFLTLYSQGLILDITNGADHYHADYVFPYWADLFRKTITLRSHIYYNSQAPLMGE